MGYLANILSFLSLACAFGSIIFSLEEHFTFASWAIIFSVIIDGLDGQIAKRYKLTSEFGRELDSLVDVIAFGIAPSVLGYIFIYRDFYLSASLTLFVYLFCSVFRLAKYNVTPKTKLVNYFYGLPTTVSGGVLASFILIYRKKLGVSVPYYFQLAFIALVLALAFLMISRVRYLNLDGIKQIFGKKLKLIFVFLFILFVLAAFFRKIGITTFLLFYLYLIFSPYLVRRLE
ncbi:MAG: CDP-alcohol phosphatidyltransferase family protein [Candidatus Omnitrophica bacterium]|nr:CDP-alcohol phosphatidyltransferase family protein [Candidatus Omnitrophota bacterium]